MCLPIGTIVISSYGTGPFEITDVEGPCTCPKYLDTLDRRDNTSASKPHYHFTCKDLRDGKDAWLNGYTIKEGHCISVWDSDELYVQGDSLTHEKVEKLSLPFVYKILQDKFTYHFNIDDYATFKVFLHCSGDVETDNAKEKDLSDIAWLEANGFIRTNRVDCRNRKQDRYDCIIYHYQNIFPPATKLDKNFLDDYHAEKFGKLNALWKYHIIPETSLFTETGNVEPEEELSVQPKKDRPKSSLKKAKKTHRMEFRYDDDFRRLLEDLRNKFPILKDETNTGIIEHCCYAFNLLNSVK